MTGTGFYNLNNDRFVLEVKTTGRWKCDLKYVCTGENINITERCDGKSINENPNDDDRERHNAPDRRENKKDPWLVKKKSPDLVRRFSSIKPLYNSFDDYPGSHRH